MLMLELQRCRFCRPHVQAAGTYPESRHVPRRVPRHVPRHVPRVERGPAVAKEGGLGQMGRLRLAGGRDEAVVGVRQVLDLVHHIAVMSFEAELAAEGPDAADPRVVGKAPQHGVVRGGEVLENRVPVPDSVGGEVGVLGQGLLLVLENQVPREFGRESEDHRAVAFLGREGKHVGNQEVEGQSSGGGKVSAGSSSIQAGLNDFL